MTQAVRDRLVVLKKAKKKLITQCEAAEEVGLSIRQLQSPWAARGSRRIGKSRKKVERQAVKILSVPVYDGF